MTNTDKEALDEILQQLQYGTIMSENQEPMLTNNRNVASVAILGLFQDRLKRAEEHGYLLGWNACVDDCPEKILVQLNQSLEEINR